MRTGLPALTKRIRQMEEELGVTLVKRNVKGMVFTIAGDDYASYDIHDGETEYYHVVNGTIVGSVGSK